MNIKIFIQKDAVQLITFKNGSKILGVIDTNENLDTNISNLLTGKILGLLFGKLSDFASFSIFLSKKNYMEYLYGLLASITDYYFNLDEKGSLDIDIPNNWIESRLIYHSSRSNVYRIRTQNHVYAVKLMTERLDDTKKDLLSKLSFESLSLSPIYYIADTDQSTFNTVIVSDFIYGKHIHGILPQSLLKRQLKCISQLETELSSIDKSSNLLLPTVSDKIELFITISSDYKVKSLGTILLNHWKRVTNNYSLTNVCIYDLHRENMILDDDNKWHIIDIDSCVFGTTTFTFSSYMASSLIVEGYSNNQVFAIIKNKYPNEIERVLLEIMIRLFFGLSFFSRTGEDKNLHSAYYNSLYRTEILLNRHYSGYSDIYIELLY